jgi:hypothetical protein
MLALRTEMGSASGQEDASDGSLAAAAGQAGALVDAVFKLKESANAVGVHIIGNGRAAEADGMFQNLAKGQAEAFEFCLGEAAGEPAGADACMKKTLIGIDVAHSRQKRLIEQGRFDWQAVAMEKVGKLLLPDREWLGAGRFERRCAVQVAKLQPAETSGIDKAKFASA